MGSETATDDPEVHATRLPGELRDPGRWYTDNGLYDLHVNVGAWLSGRKVEPDLVMEVLALAGLTPRTGSSGGCHSQTNGSRSVPSC